MTRFSNILFAAVCLGGVCANVNSAAPPPPLIVAHRGMLRHAPENTLANFQACLELRLGFEFDVGRTKDGCLICIHDDTVDRTTNGMGKVRELTLKQIRNLDAGSWFDLKFAGEKVPTVEEVLQLIAKYRQHDLLIAVDLKVGHAGQEIVRIALKNDVLHRLLFIGRTINEPKLRQQIRAASPQAQTAAVANNAQEFPKALAASNADWVYFRFLPTKKQIDAVHQAKKRTFIAGPQVSGNLPKNWQRAHSVGLNGILTDFPLNLRTTIREVDSRRTNDP